MWGMFLQADVLQIGTGVLLTVNTVMLLRISFAAGGWVEKVEGHEKRIAHLERDRCEADDCPLRATGK